MHAQASISSVRRRTDWARRFLGTKNPPRHDTGQDSGNSMVNRVPEADVTKRMSP